MLKIYEYSVQNLRELKKQRKLVKRLYNNLLVNNKVQSINALTKVYGLMYSAYVETSFLKTVHTPYGFTQLDIEQVFIDVNKKKRSIEEMWKETIKIGFSRIKGFTSLEYIYKRKKRIEVLVDKYIVLPSHLRNKLAHGQWKIALNNKMTNVNQELTGKLESIDFVEIDKLFVIYDCISQLVEDVIESPSKTHFRDFETHFVEIEDYLAKTKTWSTKSKRVVLGKKQKLRNLIPETGSQ